MPMHSEPGSWQPIETAPKDRTEILLRGRYPVTNYVSDVYHSWWDSHAWARWPHAAFGPTHWMPIPEFPKGL